MTIVDVLKTLSRGDTVGLTLRTARIGLKDEPIKLDLDQVVVIHQESNQLVVSLRSKARCTCAPASLP